MKIYTVIIYAVILSGCSTLSTSDKQEVIVNNKTKTATKYPSSYDLSFCDPVQTITYDKAKATDIVELLVNDANKLQECYDKQKALSKFINDLIVEDKK